MISVGCCLVERPDYIRLRRIPRVYPRGSIAILNTYLAQALLNVQRQLEVAAEQVTRAWLSRLGEVREWHTAYKETGKEPEFPKDGSLIAVGLNIWTLYQQCLIILETITEWSLKPISLGVS